MEKPARVEHPVHPLIQARWSPRAFAARAVPPEILRSLFEAARWAPSSINEQPWSFLVATREQPEDFARLLSCLVPANARWAKDAGVLLITAVRLTFKRNGQPNPTAQHDLGLAVAQLSFEATDRGLVLHQMAGIEGEKAQEVCAIPAEWAPVTAIALGYPGDLQSLPEDLRERELAPRQRKPQSEFVFASRWGAAPPFAS